MSDEGGLGIFFASPLRSRHGFRSGIDARFYGPDGLFDRGCHRVSRIWSRLRGMCQPGLHLEQMIYDSCETGLTLPLTLYYRNLRVQFSPARLEEMGGSDVYNDFMLEPLGGRPGPEHDYGLTDYHVFCLSLNVDGWRGYEIALKDCMNPNLLQNRNYSDLILFVSPSPRDKQYFRHEDDEVFVGYNPFQLRVAYVNPGGIDPDKGVTYLYVGRDLFDGTRGYLQDVRGVHFESAEDVGGAGLTPADEVYADCTFVVSVVLFQF